MQDKITIADAPDCLNTNDKAMWVLGYQAALAARSTCLHQIQVPSATEQAAWHAGLDEGRAQAAPAAVAVPDERAAFEVEILKYTPHAILDCHDGQYAIPWVQAAWTGFQARAALAATSAAAPVVPDGWVPCVVTYEGQHPEEVAYGPQIMMDRLKKWLERYFEQEAAAPVVLPEPEAVISELMGLVDEWGMESHLRGEAELDAQHSEATQEEIDCAKDRASKERAAWKAIESKLRALLAAGGEAQAAPAFYAALGSNGCALPQYSAGTEEGVILNVLSVARNEGYTGSGLDRLIELGWVVRPVYTRPTPATADSLATATGLPAQAVPLKLIEAINTACGGNEWQGEALAPDLLEPACRAITSLAPQAQAVPAFCHVASLKLKSLHERGYQITGYALEKPVEGAQPERGFINHGGFVGWWWDGQSPQAQADARDAEIQQAVLTERERICAAIKAEDDHCVTQGDYMLDSDDCIKVARGEWVRPVYDAAIAAAKGE